LKKQIVSLIVLVSFACAEAWAIPSPDTETRQPASISADTFSYGTEPVLTWNPDRFLVICLENCSSTNAVNLYARYKNGPFPGETKIRTNPAGNLWTVEYALKGSVQYLPIKKDMLFKLEATPTASENPGQEIKYKAWKNKGGKKGEVIQSPDWAVFAYPIVRDKKGRGEVYWVIVKDRQTGKLIVPAMNVKITHWGQTIRTLGLYAALTVTAGYLVIYVPGIIIAATPIFP